MTLASLPKILKPSGSSNLVRLGRKNDGGYLVEEEDVRRTEILIGLGLNDDWSFEEQFSALNPKPVIGYDASVGTKPFLKKAIKSLAPWFPGTPLHYLKTMVRFRKFFCGPNQHFGQHVGIARDGFMTMDEVFATHPDGLIFLKIDIEGSEYRLLDSILRNQQRLSGLVIEFHDLDIHIERIIDFVQRLALKIVATHANNFAGVSAPGGLPLVAEITFSSSELLTGKPAPHLHQPNNSSQPEIEIRYLP